jgi:hypothetical protein
MLTLILEANGRSFPQARLISSFNFHFGPRVFAAVSAPGCKANSQNAELRRRFGLSFRFLGAFRSQHFGVGASV